MPFARRREIEPEMGEAMRALPHDKWRAFVTFYLMEAPKYGAQTNACRRAGFGKPSSPPGTFQRTALRLMSDKRIQRAILEEARKLLRGAAPEGVNALLGMVRDPKHRDHARGVAMLLERTDVVETHATITHHIEVDHNTEAIESLRMFKRLGVTREKLEEMFGYSGLSRYEAMLAERDNPKRLPGPEPTKPAGPVIEGEAVEVVKPARDPGLPGDRW